MRDSLVVCDNLIKIYKVRNAEVEVVALQGLHLEVAQGEMVALVGASGSGKSTLLNIIGALDVPSAGRCCVGGYELTQLSEAQLNYFRRFVIGHVWQHSGRNVLAELSLLDNVSLPQVLARAGSRRRRQRSRELLQLVDLKGLEYRLPKQVSGGEQQRAAIAVALANNPPLLLADEPTGELDVASAQQIYTLLRRLNRELGLTVIIVTHDAAMAEAADRTIVIRDGRTSAESIHRDLTSSTRLASNESNVTSDFQGGVFREAVRVDQGGWLQLPAAAMQQLTFSGRAAVWKVRDHVELWPLESTPSALGKTLDPSGTAVSRLSTWPHREAVVIDRVGRLQLPKEALETIPFNGRANVRVAVDHVELWPPAAEPRLDMDLEEESAT